MRAAARTISPPRLPPALGCSASADRVHHEPVAEIGPPRPFALVVRVRDRDAIGRELSPALGVVLVEPRGVLAEDRPLHRAVGGAERRPAVLLLHILRDLEPPQRLDLPLWRPGPDCVGAQTTWSAPSPFTSVPIMAAHRRGSATLLCA